MFDIHDFIKLISPKFNDCYISEDFDSYKLNAKIETLELVEQKEFETLFTSFAAFGDRILVTLDYEENSIATLDSKTLDISKFIYDCHVNKKIEDDDNAYTIRMILEKDITKKSLNIYDLNSFTAYLNNLTLQGLLSLIDKKIYRNKCFIHLLNESHDISTNAFYITNRDVSISEIEMKYDSHKYLLKDHCHCVMDDSSIFLPDFYRITEIDESKLASILNSLSVVSSFAYLFDFVEIKGNLISIKLSGYKTIIGTLNWKDFSKHNLVLTEIARWVFSSNNIEDKLGIFRNILSLNIITVAEVLEIGRDIFDSILSSHEIYLKENVNQYIQVKSVFIEHHISLLSTLNELTDSLISNLKNNFIAFFTFFISVIVLNSISTGKIDNIFNNTIYVISIVLLLISFFILVLGILEVYYKWKRQKDTILSTKNEYADVLNQNDIDNIFNKSIDLKQARRKAITSTIVIGLIWLLCLVSLFIGVRYLNSIYVESVKILQHVI